MNTIYRSILPILLSKRGLLSNHSYTKFKMNVVDIRKTVKLSLSSFIHSHSGETDSNKFRNGTGTEFWKHEFGQQIYCGFIQHNCLHGYGTYKWNDENSNYTYEGYLFANNLEGYGVLSYPDGKIFEGLFSYNRKYGPGVLTYSDGTQDVGLWYGDSLIRLNQASSIGIVPQLTNTIQGKTYLLQYKSLVPICDELNPEIENILNQLKSTDDALQKRNEVLSKLIRNKNSNLFNQKLFCDSFFNNEIDFTVDVTENGGLVRKVEVTHLLAWNNEDLAITIMKHSFRHRNSETLLSYRVSDLLTGQRQLFRTPGTHEALCLNLLQNSCYGNDQEIIKLICENDLYPDLADSLGNTGIIIAASENKVDIIKVFVDFGANVDHQNDECLTPLLLTVLKYIALKNEVVDWEKAFLPTFVAKENKVEVQEWRNRRISELNDNPGIDGLQKYLFNLECVHPEIEGKLKEKNRNKGELAISSKRSKKKRSVDTNPTMDSTKEKIEQDTENAKDELDQKIIKTILTLLQCGANPNFGSVPFPPLILSLFTKKADVLSLLLNYGANCNITSSEFNGNLTPLHIIASIPPFPELPQMAQILLENGANPNKLCSTNHWLEEKDILLAGIEAVDLGKTPLHLLCMRYDFKEDICDHLGELLTTLLNHGTDVRVMYLGHTALSLAIIRGNLRLIHRILSSDFVDPNESLGNGMGVPLTVLALKRYTGILPLHVCENVFNILLKYYANPLNFVSGFNGNTVEFAINDNSSLDVSNIIKDIHNNENTKNGRKGNIDNSSKRIKKKHGSESVTPHRKGKTKKGDKDRGNEKIIEMLRSCAFKTLVKHLKAKAVKFIYDYKIQLEIDDCIFDDLVKFVDVHDAATVLQILIDNNKIYIDKRLCYKTLKYVNNQTDTTRKNIKTRGKSKSSQSIIQPRFEELFSSLDFNRKETEKVLPFKLYMPEIDPKQEKYKICFECLQKTNKELILCPKCELVYFCSQRCNIANNKQKTIHQCNIVFYDSEKERISELLQNGGIVRSKLNSFKKQQKIYMDETHGFFENLKQQDSAELLQLSHKDSLKKHSKKQGNSDKSSSCELINETSKSQSKGREKSVGKKKKQKTRSSKTESEKIEKRKEDRSKLRKDDKSKGKTKRERSESKDQDKTQKGKQDKKSKEQKKGSRSKSPVSVKSRSRQQKRKSKDIENKEDRNKGDKSKFKERKKRSSSKLPVNDKSKSRQQKLKLKEMEYKGDRKKENSGKSKERKKRSSSRSPVSDKSRSRQQKRKSKEIENKGGRQKQDRSTEERQKQTDKSRSRSRVSGKSKTQKTKEENKDRSKTRESLRKQIRSDTQKKLQEKSQESPELDHQLKERMLGKMQKGLTSIGYLDSVSDICGFDFKFYEMFMPYCVFVDGQLYYKFDDRNVFCPLTYSNV